MTDRELMQQALYYMDDGCGKYNDDYRKLIDALRARLAQPEPEPVAWLYEGSNIEGKDVCLNEDIFEEQKPNCIPLYTAPPQREWQGLTDEEIEDLWGEPVDLMYSGHYNAIRAIEAKLKEKNHG